MTFSNIIESVIGNHVFVLVTILISFLLKLLIIIFTINQSVNTRVAQRLRLLLLAILIANMFSDIAWILELLQNMSLLKIDPHMKTFIGRVSWGFVGMQYQGLALFLEGLVTRKFLSTIRQKICCAIAVLFMLFQMSTAFIYFDHPEAFPLIIIINRIVITYYTLFLLPFSLLIVICKLRSEPLPHILSKQLRIIIYGLIIPHLVSEIIQSFPVYFKTPAYDWVTSSYAVVALSALFLSIALFYSARKVMGLRFLNLRDHVQALPKLNFITNFKVILDQLGQVATTRELQFVTQNFFKEAHGIPLKKTRLYLHPVAISSQEYEPRNHISETVATFINASESTTNNIIRKMKVLIYDEINFSHFYEETTEHEKLLTFLTRLQADIFLPIYSKDKLIAYIIIDRHSREEEFYNNAERDEMAMFAGYLSNTISLLLNQSVEALTKKVICLTLEKENLRKNFTQEKEDLSKELYLKHQENSQYREGFQYFLYSNPKQIGIIFYKNNRFIFGNQEAKNFIPININTQIGHPLVKKLKQVTDQVANFRSPQTVFVKNEQGNTISLSAIPHLEQNNIIIIISHPDIPDLVKQKINFLKNPSRWDYLLYLETTESGRLINQLIPGNGKTLLDFKIELLKTALGKKATLLDVAQEDLLPIVETLHRISLRENLHILNLQDIPGTVTIASKLFGINPLLGAKKEAAPPLLELLNNRGTLFIKDIHLLDLTCQEYLAEFIRYGLYRIYKSKQRKRSNVRIICSSNQNIPDLIKENNFSPSLFAQLEHTTLRMPSLSGLSKEELNSLADNFSQQAVSSDTFKNLLALTDKDKTKLAQTQPASLQELKTHVKQILMQKAEKNNIHQETKFDPAYETNDSELIQASRLGKHALKDKKIMTMLWKKFKNQSKIAGFLGVNRSSVHHRCKLYNLTDPSKKPG